jgi:hypothetical protein
MDGTASFRWIDCKKLEVVIIQNHIPLGLFLHWPNGGDLGLNFTHR